MPDCCDHRDDEHRTVSTCQEVIHYPSEDYPCLCSGFLPRADGACERCEHPAASHVTARVCKPESGEFCGCRK